MQWVIIVTPDKKDDQNLPREAYVVEEWFSAALEFKAYGQSIQ